VAVLVVDEDKEVVGDTVDDAEGDILDVVECD
jgi:tRNA A37 threonylcarbamoyltransferase TsaD